MSSQWTPPRRRRAVLPTPPGPANFTQSGTPLTTIAIPSAVSSGHYTPLARSTMPRIAAVSAPGTQSGAPTTAPTSAPASNTDEFLFVESFRLIPEHILTTDLAPEDGPWHGKKCSICLSEFTTGESVKLLSCNHYEHSACLKQWLKSNPTCPVCRTATFEERVTKVLTEANRVAVQREIRDLAVDFETLGLGAAETEAARQLQARADAILGRTRRTRPPIPAPMARQGAVVWAREAEEEAMQAQIQRLERRLQDLRAARAANAQGTQLMGNIAGAWEGGFRRVLRRDIEGGSRLRLSEAEIRRLERLNRP